MITETRSHIFRFGTLEKRAPDPKIIGTSKKRKPWNRLITEVEITSLSVAQRSAMMDFLSQ